MELKPELNSDNTETIEQVFSGRDFVDKIYKLFKYFQAEKIDPLEAIALMKLAAQMLEKHNGIVETNMKMESTHEA